MEEWGQLVSVGLGVYYLYKILRTIFTACFSLRVLYQEHGVSPSLLWGLGVGRNLFPMRFYRRWRRAQNHREDQPPRPPPRPFPADHEYLALDSVARPAPTQETTQSPRVYPGLEKERSRLPSYSVTPPAAVPFSAPKAIALTAERNDHHPAGQETPDVCAPEPERAGSAATPDTLPNDTPAHRGFQDPLFPSGPIGDIMTRGHTNGPSRRTLQCTDVKERTLSTFRGGMCTKMSPL